MKSKTKKKDSATAFCQWLTKNKFYIEEPDVVESGYLVHKPNKVLRMWRKETR